MQFSTHNYLNIAQVCSYVLVPNNNVSNFSIKSSLRELNSEYSTMVLISLNRERVMCVVNCLLCNASDSTLLQALDVWAMGVTLYCFVFGKVRRQ